MPLQWKVMTGEEIVRKGNYHLKLGEGNEVQLKCTSWWYTQVQSQLAVTEYSWCNFVVFTQKELHIYVCMCVCEETARRKRGGSESGKEV